MNSIARNLAWAVLAGAIFSAGAHGADPAMPPAALAPPPEAAKQTPAIEKLGDGKYRLGDIVVDKAERSITFPAEVNMDRGLLEYLIVHRRGKTHESLLRTTVEPYSLQVAFLLVDYEGGEERLARQGDPATPKGEPVQIAITTGSGTDQVTISAERWLVNRFGDEIRDIGPMNWVFTGSYFYAGRFMSQETGSITAIWHDPMAMIDNASQGGESNRIWFVKQGIVPPVGTPVRVIIKPAK